MLVEGPEFGVTGSGVGVGVQARCGGGVGWNVGGDCSRCAALSKDTVSGDMGGAHEWGAVRYVRGHK